ncbi:phosphotransferase family protein [Paraburkholderia sp. BCC1885]|uniref:phosphotransferase family protein n=1 Tax=Paraburkholderia sp. BCC1885 TaxID=2562669 RepID=UPI0011822EE6|nr:aminoglycoside phosphotransferase family protein [Paraburkholderia sp. BCC1885]
MADAQNPQTASASSDAAVHAKGVIDPQTDVSDDEAAAIAQAALKSTIVHVSRQTLTQSGNAIFRVQLADGRAVAVRVNPRRGMFSFTQHNFDALRELGLPVPRVLASGTTARQGSFIVLEWVPGRDLQYELAGMSAPQMTRIAETVSDYQKRVAALPESRGFGWAPVRRHASTARWTDIFGQTSNEEPRDDAPALDHLRARLRAIRRSVEPYFASLRPICFLDDLTVKNVLVEHGDLQGIIDVDFVCYGDPLMAVGTTLAHIAADVGEEGRFYGDELIRCAAPSPDAERAIYFYGSLWMTGFLAAAEAAGDVQRATELMTATDTMLRAAESGLHI